MIINTERLILRPISKSDAGDMFEYASRPHIGPAAGWAPHKDINETLEIIKKLSDTKLVWAIVIRETGKMIGSIGVTPLFNPKIKTYSIGYVLNDLFWGNGYATEATRGIISCLFSVMDAEVIRITHKLSNERSRRVIIKCGFKFEGLIKWLHKDHLGNYIDSLQYSITKDEFMSHSLSWQKE